MDQVAQDRQMAVYSRELRSRDGRRHFPGWPLGRASIAAAIAPWFPTKDPAEGQVLVLESAPTWIASRLISTSSACWGASTAAMCWEWPNPGSALLNIAKVVQGQNDLPVKAYRLLEAKSASLCRQLRGRDVLSGQFRWAFVNGYTGNVLLKVP